MSDPTPIVMTEDERLVINASGPCLEMIMRSYGLQSGSSYPLERIRNFVPIPRVAKRHRVLLELDAEMRREAESQKDAENALARHWAREELVEHCRLLARYSTCMRIIMQHPILCTSCGGAHARLDLRFRRVLNACVWTVARLWPHDAAVCRGSVRDGFSDDIWFEMYEADGRDTPSGRAARVSSGYNSKMRIEQIIGAAAEITKLDQVLNDVCWLPTYPRDVMKRFMGVAIECTERTAQLAYE